MEGATGNKASAMIDDASMATTGAAAPSPIDGLKPESDDLCLWSARTSIESNHPRPFHSVCTQPLSCGAEHCVTVRENATVSHAFAELMREGFLSCPVVNEKCGYVAQIELPELAAFVVDKFREYHDYDDVCCDLDLYWALI